MKLSYNKGVQNNYQRYYDTFSNSRSLWDYGMMEPYADATNTITAITPYVAGAINSGVSILPPVMGLSQCDYLSRGAIYAVSVAKASDNKSTQCTVNINFFPDPSNTGGYSGLTLTGAPLLLLMRCYKRWI